MKTTTHSLLIAAIPAVIASSTAVADDPQLQNRLAIQQAQAARDIEKTPTIGVYASNRGVGRRMGRNARDARSESALRCAPPRTGKATAFTCPLGKR